MGDLRFEKISFPSVSDHPYEQMESILDAGFHLVEILNSGTVFKSERVALFLTTIHLERAADYYRGFINPDARREYPDDHGRVLEKLDQFRNEIWVIREALSTEEVEVALEIEGNDFSQRFAKA